MNNKDAEQLKSLFSKQTLELCPDIDKGIEYIFSISKVNMKKPFIRISQLKQCGY
ncbi:MAG: hypothetical protein ACI4I6_08480 [Hominimerdicola sp.]